MTRAKMNWIRLTLEMEGHAGAKNKDGVDIVCAAESILTQALLQTLFELEEERKGTLDWTGAPGGGYLKIEVIPKSANRKEIEACFRVCVTGLRMLEERYPEHIRLKEV